METEGMASVAPFTFTCLKSGGAAKKQMASCMCAQLWRRGEEDRSLGLSRDIVAFFRIMQVFCCRSVLTLHLHSFALEYNLRYQIFMHGRRYREGGRKDSMMWCMAEAQLRGLRTLFS